MKIKAAFVGPMLLALAACGGGSTSSNSGESFTTLSTFSDGAGVGRSVATDGSTQALIIAPNIAQLAETRTGSPSAIKFADFPVVQTLPTASVRRGTVSASGVVANVLIVEDKGGKAGLVYIEVPGVTDALAAVGSGYGVAPSGQFVYNGVHVIGERYGSQGGDGQFSLTADFSKGTFTYSGFTQSTSLVGSGVLNSADGRFASSTMTSNVLGDVKTATLHGQMHGAYAESVSGVFYTNDRNPVYAGGFVGSR